VEANFVIFWNDKAKAGKPAEIKSSPFIQTLRSKADEHPNFGALTRVWVRVETKETGSLDGSISVQCGGATVKVPVQATVLPQEPLSSRVLVAETPFDGYSAGASSAFAAWRRVVDTGKLEVHYLNQPEKGPVLPVSLLEKVDVVLMGQSCLLGMTKEDVNLLQGFVCGGGRVVMAADCFFRGSVAKANEVLTAFGLRMDDVEPSGAADFVIGEDHITKHSLTSKVVSLRVSRPTPTTITDPRRATTLVRVSAFPDRAFIALSRTESGGEVVALGQSLWWSWLKEDQGNVRLLRNLLTRKRKDR